jgi:hypothetical protein
MNMDTKKAIGDLVSGFVDDLLGAIRRLLDEEVATALRGLSVPGPKQPTPDLPQMKHPPEGTTAGLSPSAPTTSPTSKRKSKTSPPGQKTRTPTSKKREGTSPSEAVKSAKGKSSSRARKPGKTSSSAVSKGATLRAATKTSAKKSQKADAVGTQLEREAKVLEAVRSLNKPKASDIVKHTGLSKKVVYTTLLTLVERNQVTKAEASHGAEFVLGVAGGVQSTKPGKAGPSAGGEKKPARAKQSHSRTPVAVKESVQSMIA